MQLCCKPKIYKEIYRMFARGSQMLRNKRHFVISVIAINVFYCIYTLYMDAKVNNLLKVIFLQQSSMSGFYTSAMLVDLYRYLQWLTDWILHE